MATKANPPTLSWQTQQIDLKAELGNVAQYTFSFAAPIKSHTVGLTGFNFSSQNGKGIYLQNFGIHTSVISVDVNTITVAISATHLDYQNYNYGGWVKVTVLAWLDEGDGHPPVLFASRKNIPNGDSASFPVEIPMEGDSPEFQFGKDFFGSFLSGFQLSLGVSDLENNPLTATYMQAGTGLDLLGKNLRLSGQAKMRGIGETTVYQTTIPTKNNPDGKSKEDDKKYPIINTNPGQVDTSCLIMSKQLDGYGVAPISFSFPNLKDGQSFDGRNSKNSKLPFTKEVSDFIFLLQSFTIGKIRGNPIENAQVDMLYLDLKPFFNMQSGFYEYIGAVVYYVGGTNSTTPYYLGFSNVNGIMIAKF